MPAIETLFLPVLSILAMESADFIRSLYRHFSAGLTTKSLNAFYYACSYAKADHSRFMNVTAGMALRLIPEKLSSQPVFLCIDDTMVSKSGKKFADVSKLFDHAAHHGSNYLNGHCFVSVMLCVPVRDKNRIQSRLDTALSTVSEAQKTAFLLLSKYHSHPGTAAETLTNPTVPSPMASI